MAAASVSPFGEKKALRLEAGASDERQVVLATA